MSSCEEEDDEHNLDNGKDGDPQQEDMDKGMLGLLWHRQSVGRAQSSLSLGSTGRQMLRELTTVQVPSFLCCALAQCVYVRFLSSVCECDEEVLLSDCALP